MTFAEIQDALKKISKWPWQRYEDAVDIGDDPSTRQTLYFNKLEDAIFFQQSPQIISDLLTRLIKAEAEMQRRCAEAIKTCASNWTHYETRGDFIAALIKAIEALK